MIVPSKLAGCRFLVVDDESDYVDYMSELLRLAGADHVASAADGTEALEQLAASRSFSLVLTDQRMPTPSGVQLLAMARTAGFLVPFLIVTAFPDDEIRAAVARLDRAEILGKPFEPTHLVATVGALISRSQ